MTMRRSARAQVRHTVWLSLAVGCSSPSPAPAPAPADPPAVQAPRASEAETPGEAAAPKAPAAADPRPAPIGTEHAAPPPDTQLGPMNIEGKIEAIVLQNINKARGHFTYNVELVVSRPGAADIRVRVDKVYWSRLSASRQNALAPDGPAERLSPATYEKWTVGDEVSLPAEVTSPGLAHLRP